MGLEAAFGEAEAAAHFGVGQEAAHHDEGYGGSDESSNDEQGTAVHAH